MARLINLSYEIDKNLDDAIHALKNATSGVALAGVLQAVVLPYLKQRGANRFAQEGDDVTGPWESLRPATERFREEQGFGRSHPINRRTGQLEEYIVGSPGAVVPSPNSATLTYPGNPPTGPSLEKKLRTAQEGDGITVARPVLGINEADLLFVAEAFDAMFTRVLK